MVLSDLIPLQQDLPFGIRIGGITREKLVDPTVRAEIFDLFEQHGMILFEGVEASSEMHVALSNVFGPLKDHPVKEVSRVDRDGLPGVVEIKHAAEEKGLVEIAGQQLVHWLPWHFDHCYNNELNRAGVLRAIDIVEEGGLTGFADGISLHKSLPAELLDKIRDKEIIYTLSLIYNEMRFGVPANFSEISVKPLARELTEKARTMPRAVHPAVWTRKTGEPVLHISPWMAAGIAGAENPEGDALLEEVCQAIYRIARTQAYFHKWKPNDMLVWDNWRMLHMVTGHQPGITRTMQRTTIKGDYGLGHFEGEGAGGKILEMTF